MQGLNELLLLSQDSITEIKIPTFIHGNVSAHYCTSENNHYVNLFSRTVTDITVLSEHVSISVLHCSQRKQSPSRSAKQNAETVV